jgi:hypothetical protein
LVDENNLRAINQAIIPGRLSPKMFFTCNPVLQHLDAADFFWASQPVAVRQIGRFRIIGIGVETMGSPRWNLSG